MSKPPEIRKRGEEGGSHIMLGEAKKIMEIDDRFQQVSICKKGDMLGRGRGKLKETEQCWTAAFVKGARKRTQKIFSLLYRGDSSHE